jgi:hypothetical protein
MNCRCCRAPRGSLHGDKPVVLMEQRRRDFAGGTSPCLEFLKSAGYRRFATIQKSPRLGNSYLTVLARLVCGERIEMTEVTHFKPDFYSMIAAVP